MMNKQNIAIGVGLVALWLSRPKGTQAGGGGVGTEAKKRIARVIGAIESRLNYGAINTVDPSVEVSYGIMQATLRSGNLDKLLKQYAKEGGKYASQLNQFANAQGDWTSSKLAYSSEFKKLLREAGTDPRMKRAQDIFFGNDFLKPAYDYAVSELELKTPAGWLVVADSFINSGPNYAKQHLDNIGRTGNEVADLLTYLSWRTAFFTRLYNGRIAKTNTSRAKAKFVTDRDYGVWRVGSLLPSIVRNNPNLEDPVIVRYPKWRSGVKV
jgi:hypothetical protein